MGNRLGSMKALLATAALAAAMLLGTAAATYGASGTIDGYVKDQSGNPIQFVEVTAMESETYTSMTDVTDANGYYSLSGLPSVASGYEVSFSAENLNNGQGSDYLFEYWNNQGIYGTPTRVAAGTTLGNTVLMEGGQISGRVTSPAGSGLVGIDVTVTDNGDFVVSARTGANGNYILHGIPFDVTDAYVWFDTAQFNADHATEYLDEYWNNSHSSDAVTEVSAGDTGIDAQLEVGLSIDGYVKSVGGNPIQFVWVTASEDESFTSYQAMTDANGYYRLAGLPAIASGYTVAFDPNYLNNAQGSNFLFEYWQNVGVYGTPTQVQAGATLGDTVLAEGGEVSGTVVDGSGSGVEGLDVIVMDNGDFRVDCQTKAGGVYVAHGVPLDMVGAYVFFDTEGYNFDTNSAYVAEYWDNVYISDRATPVFAGATLVNAQLDEAVTISGYVTASTGGALDMIEVFAYDWLLRNNDYGSATTGADGYYEVQVPPDTDIRLLFDADWHNESFADRCLDSWYNGGYRYLEATQLNTGSGLMINESLTRGRYITGLVTDGSRAVPGVAVTVYQPDVDADEWPEFEASAVTGANGRYSVGPVPPGEYFVSFDPSTTAGWEDYPMRWWPAASSEASAQRVAITTATDRTNIDVTISLPPVVPPVVLTPVYRFYNTSNGTHFFTPSAEERDMVLAKWGRIFALEGVAYQTNPANNSQPLYRFYNKRNGSHFYTASAQERDAVIAKWPAVFSYDGETYKVSPVSAPGKLAVFRFYNKRNGSHFFTASAEERDTVIARWSATYDFEGTAFWVGQ